MTLIQLRYIVAVDVHRHFAAAADSCFVTQPTLSMQISKLEKELDVLIFDRGKFPIEPTEVGKKILKQAKLVLNESARIEEIVKASKGQISGEFKLGIIPTVSPSLLPRFLKKITTDYPDIYLKIEELQTEQILEKLDKDQLDAAIMATPLENPSIIERPMYYEPFMAFIPKGHRLENEAFVLHSELRLSDILLLKSGHCFRDSIINLCEGAFPQSGNANQILEFESGNFETLIRLSHQGFGMTLLPYLTALDLDEGNRAFIKPIEHPQPTREISFVYSKAQLKTSIIKVLEKEIKAALPKKILENTNSELISPMRK